jgi:hypothetical protein
MKRKISVSASQILLPIINLVETGNHFTVSGSMQIPVTVPAAVVCVMLESTSVA